MSGVVVRIDVGNGGKAIVAAQVAAASTIAASEAALAAAALADQARNDLNEAGTTTTMRFRGIPTIVDEIEKFQWSGGEIFFDAGMPGCLAASRIAATAQTVFSVRKDNIQFATITFAIGSTVGVWASLVDVSFITGNWFSIMGPAVPDLTLEDLYITLKYHR